MKRKQAESERPILPANQKLITLSVQDAPTKKGNSWAGALTTPVCSGSCAHKDFLSGHCSNTDAPFDKALNVTVFPEFVINPNGKSEVCILHEYMQRVLKVRPVYNFFECGKC